MEEFNKDINMLMCRLMVRFFPYKFIYLRLEEEHQNQYNSLIGHVVLESDKVKWTFPLYTWNISGDGGIIEDVKSVVDKIEEVYGME